MKRIGIIGGLSPESTLLLYKYLIEEYRKLKEDDCYPEIIIDSLSFCRFSKYMRSSPEKAKEMLKVSLERLEMAGAEIIAIAANTPHMFFDDLLRHSNATLVSIIDVLAEELEKNNVKVVGLLGTKKTLTEGFYTGKLEEKGFKVLVPETKDIEKLNDIIMKELVKGIVKESSKKFVLDIADKLVKSGAQGIALSCTELPLVFLNVKTKYRIFDTTRLLAKKLVSLALLP